MMEGRRLEGHAADRYQDLARLFTELDEKLDEDGTIRSSDTKSRCQQDSGYGVEDNIIPSGLGYDIYYARMRFQGLAISSCSLHVAGACTLDLSGYHSDDDLINL
jgi:hypothetical protein